MTLTHHELGAASGGMAFLHGILGTGANWKSIASALLEDLPQNSATLVDLRMHGRSQSFSSPHTIDAAARDLLELEAARGSTFTAVLGHSFGSKVALRYSALRAEAGAPLSDVFIIDAAPSAAEARTPDANAPRRPDDVDRVLAALDVVGSEFEDRRAFTSALGDQGIALPVAQWLAMNLRMEEGRYRFILDLGAIRELLGSFRETDAWPWIEQSPSRVHFVVGTRSSVVRSTDLERFRALAESEPGRRTVSELDAGHWVHVDDPRGLQQAVGEALRG